MIAFLDLNRLNGYYADAFRDVLAEVSERQSFVLGKYTADFENAWARYTGARYAVGTGNGSDALFLILEAYKILGRLKEGDRVLVPANTYIASILPVLRARLQPVAVDPNPQTLNLTVEALEKHRDIKAVIAVHLYGRLAIDRRMQQWCKTQDILLIEDAAQAHGARNRAGRAGALGDAAAWSFYPTKNLGALGDAGAVSTDDGELAHLIRILRHYGQAEKYNSRFPGINSRLDTLQAGFLLAKLPDLDRLNARRLALARNYARNIRNPEIRIPESPFDGSHVYHQFTVLSPRRDALKNHLEQQGISTIVHYPVPPHRQGALRGKLSGDFPVTERICREILSLPMDPYLSDEEQEHIIEAINRFKKPSL